MADVYGVWWVSEVVEVHHSHGTTRNGNKNINLA